jgi:hypothetical protein
MKNIPFWGQLLIILLICAGVVFSEESCGTACSGKTKANRVKNKIVRHGFIAAVFVCDFMSLNRRRSFNSECFGF